MRSVLVNFGSEYYMLMWVNVTQRRLGTEFTSCDNGDEILVHRLIAKLVRLLNQHYASVSATYAMMIRAIHARVIHSATRSDERVERCIDALVGV